MVACSVQINLWLSFPKDVWGSLELINGSLIGGASFIQVEHFLTNSSVCDKCRHCNEVGVLQMWHSPHSH